jgi:hypothetical protein
MSILPKSKSSRPMPIEAPVSQLMTSDLVKKRDRRFKLIMGGITGLIVVQLLFYATWLTSSAFKIAQAPKGTAVQTTASLNDYQAIATAIAQGWLNDNAASDLPLNGVDPTLGRASSGPISYTGLYFDKADFKSVPYPSGKTNLGKTVLASLPLVVDHFILTTTNATYDLAIPLAVDNGVPSLYGLPYLGPATITPSNSPTAISTKYPSLSVNQSTSTAINSWVTAFVKGDSQTLYLLSGDPNQDHYIGLSGWTENGNPTVNYAYALNPNEAVVNVTIPVTASPPSTTAASPPSTTVPSASLSYDLLLSNMTKAVPSVSAWGPTGSGPTLTPYQNAQSGTQG